MGYPPPLLSLWMIWVVPVLPYPAISTYCFDLPTNSQVPADLEPPHTAFGSASHSGLFSEVSCSLAQ